jgi:ABC-2 type transport system permease protein
MEALMSTEVSIYEILLSKLISYFILGMVSMGLCVFVAIVGYSIPLRGSLFLLGIVSAVFLFAALGTGLLISTLAKNQIVASQAALITGFLPAYILSGFLFEITSMPLVIQLLTYLMPSRYFVQSLQTLFLTGNVMHLIVFDLFFMLLIGLTLFLFAAQKTVKLLE